MQPTLEIALFTAASALPAQQAGATRLELCTSRPTGGLTPPLSSLSALRNGSTPITLPVRVMVRPRAGDFVYSASELEEMRTTMRAVIEGDLASGFVFGILTAEGRVDEEACAALVAEARGRDCTFHRAFDEAPVGEMEEAVAALGRVGFRSILTSGGRGNAVGNVEVLERLVRRGEEVGVEVIAGGGVRSGNVGMLLRATGARAWHSAAVVGEGEEVSEEEVRKLREEIEKGMEGL